MKTLIIAFLLVLFAFGSAVAQSNTAPDNGSQAIMAASSSLRILSPTVGQKIGSTSIDVRYEVTDEGAAAAPSPTYRVQLDSRDATETLDNEFNFTGLSPGPHTLTVELVDANHTPITGSQAVVHFNTFTPGVTAPSGGAQAQPQTTGALAPPAVVKTNMPLPPANPADQLPSAGGELPLLAMVGFGVLAGGVISALRTRK